ncbi:MAG: monooxygenase [Rhizobacter sp.]|nr:monooxygenase [Rhizobacter sp.]
MWQPGSSTDDVQHCDVAIVGGGFAGTCAASALSRLGLAVTLVELEPTPRDRFRVEKISLDQLQALDELGLLDAVRAASTVAVSAINIRGRSVIDRPRVEDHGLRYADVLKILHAELPAAVRRVCGRVCAIDTSADRQSVRLTEGSRLSARLVVIATGHARAVRELLGVAVRAVHPTPTTSIAFTLRAGPAGFGFPSMAAYGERAGDGVDYTSIFPIGDSMRVNVFMFTQMSDARVTAFKPDPMAALLSLQPGLTRWLDGCEVVGKPEFFVLELSICDRVVQPGVVLIGDAFRTACPGIGDGLNCVLQDVLALARSVGRWMRTPGMGADKIEAFYDDPLKRAQDHSAHQRAFQRRTSVLSTGFANRLRRSAHFARRRLLDQFRPAG